MTHTPDESRYQPTEALEECKLDAGKPCATCTAELARRESGCAMTIEVVYVGSAGHLKRYKVLDANGKYVPGGLFRTQAEAEAFIREQS